MIKNKNHIESEPENCRQVINFPLLLSDTAVNIKGSRVYIYCRLANKDGFALEKQKKELLQYAETAGLKVVGIAVEYTNGFSLKRPGLKKVSRAVSNNEVDTVLVYSSSHISRYIWQLQEYVAFLNKHNAVLYCVKGQATITLAS